MSEHACFIQSLVCTVCFVHLSSIKFLTGYYLMSISYHNVISGYIEYKYHRPVIRESAETIKIRIVYDASAKACQTSTNLNECLETGPPLQNQLWDILMRS